MRDKLEKYLLIKYQFPDKAGELQRLFASQKRIIKALGYQKDKNVAELMLLTSEAQDVSNALIDWMHQVLKGVCEDAELLQGAKAKNTISILNQEMNRLRSIVNDITGQSHYDTIRANKKTA